jgi:glucose-1-phosphate thymidylyltransferase
LVASTFLVGSDFIAGSDSALVLGDNIFYGHDVPETIRSAADRPTGATIFAYRVANPRAGGGAKTFGARRARDN